MLSVSEIVALLGTADETGISLIPEPDLSDIKRRAGTSIDLRLGRWFRSFKQTHTPAFRLAPARHPDDNAQRASTNALPTKQHFIQFGKPFVVHPGSFVLGTTLEWLTLPSGLSAYVTGKSTLGRHGLIIETASGIHPGFSGCLTLELANVGEIPLEISPGMKICQVFFHEVTAEAATTTGVASGSRKPLLPRLSRDTIFERLSKMPVET